jgi:hypothetical protein
MNSSLKPVKPKSPRPAKRFAPARVDSTDELAQLQRAMWSFISRPLTPDSRTQRRWTDGRRTADLAAQIAKPNDRLTSLERMEIYNRGYWFRVLDSLYDDCPGLRAVLGDKKFILLAEAYLSKYPSRSFTLRNLPNRLARFIREHPEFTRPHADLCYNIARFEWARIEVWDSEAKPVFTTDDLLDANPAKLHLNLQPYLQLLDLAYPVDDFILQVKQREEMQRGEASNTSLHAPTLKARQKLRLPERERTYVAVHRLNSVTYYKRLAPAGYKILTAIRRGLPLDAALAVGIPKSRHPREDWAAKVQGWFKIWMELGWFCRR